MLQFSRIFVCHKYAFDENSINTLKENFNIYLNRFLAYIRSYKPVLNDREEIHFAIFLKTLFKIVIIITRPNKTESICNEIDNMNCSYICYTMLYDECRKFFDLSEKINEVKLESADWTLDSWGKHYWNFLHALSILVQYCYQTKCDELLHNYVAALILNFDLILPCNTCRENYKLKKPLINLALPIIYSKDVIFVIYNLHNNIRVTNGLENFPFDQFLNSWNIKLLGVDTKTVNARYLLE
ncbi:hypothetical protein G9C98_001671 [Cotesia typhae]|uniref:ERV/ALR sulfhydryl oxidase domain-containing protein n=1 Tax=Cotesia typhae TaxID=2053667 RepID=A0A8J5QZE2_9HYME|nr:hypothetical protein G9C98_001671 [Cotesia typhae]